MAIRTSLAAFRRSPRRNYIQIGYSDDESPLPVKREPSSPSAPGMLGISSVVVAVPTKSPAKFTEAEDRLGDDGDACASVKGRAAGDPFGAAGLVHARPSTTTYPRAYWREQLAHIEQMRSHRDAPVDSMGCERLPDVLASPAVQRFQILVSLMLSAQTKDAITAAAVHRLRRHGLTIDNVIRTSEEVSQVFDCGRN